MGIHVCCIIQTRCVGNKLKFGLNTEYQYEYGVQSRGRCGCDDVCVCVCVHLPGQLVVVHAVQTLG